MANQFDATHHFSLLVRNYEVPYKSSLAKILGLSNPVQCLKWYWKNVFTAYTETRVQMNTYHKETFEVVYYFQKQAAQELGEDMDFWDGFKLIDWTEITKQLLMSSGRTEDQGMTTEEALQDAIDGRR